MFHCGEFTKAQARIHTEGERGDPEKVTKLLWEAAKNMQSIQPKCKSHYADERGTKI